MKIRWSKGVLALGLSTLAACHQDGSQSLPPAPADIAQPESVRLKELPQPRPASPPALARAADVGVFLDWLARASQGEREDARRVLQSAAADAEITAGLIGDVERSHRSDYTRGLLGLSALGESRSVAAVRFLQQFVNRPLPEQGTVVDGQILERSQQAKLQAKAVDGLAFANTPESNAAVKRIIATHPSRVVRAEAINAYLWNRGDSEQAKTELKAFVRPEDQLLLERVRRSTGEKQDTFNAKIDRFLERSPEARPPIPPLPASPPREPLILVSPPPR